ncbi:centrosome-associated protein ALMS1 [Heteronotia binoei]|uniref:centrosome-associated protein ALMS1 n=1 Tax=Heteronotia binoei TaxID=13085 RepID=UPI002930EEBB|nr:centrosome-associated protein ALMS1 [Heteronotia binoei]
MSGEELSQAAFCLLYCFAVVSDSEVVIQRPIATTPPRRGWKEELVSQSSSGTHVSNASGISLGEAIKHQSGINRGMEAWYQPYTEIDTSELIAAVGRRLGHTSGASGLTEFPTADGGLITPSDESGRQHAPNLTHTPLLEVQDSRLSPNLPLLTTYSTQGRTFFNETLFQALGTDFAPLRGTPDNSSSACETSRPLQASEAVRAAAHDVSSDVDCFSLSQHPFTLSTVTPSNTSPGSCLSQYPLSFSRPAPTEWGYDSGEHPPHFVAGTDALVSEDRNAQVLGMQKLLNQPSATSLPPEAPRGTVPSHDPFLLDSTVPAPLLLEMLEREVGLPKDSRFLSSSESSSCKSVLGKDPEGNETNWLAENTVPGPRESDAFVAPHREGGRSAPGPESSRPFSDSEGKPFTNASLPGRSPAQTLRAALANQGHGAGDPGTITGWLPRPLPDEQQQQVSAAESERSKEDRVSAGASSRRNTPAPFQVTVSQALGDTDGKRVNSAALGTQTEVNKKDLTLSGYSIKREHKNTGISRSFAEGSFFGYLAHPINHSTPGIAPARALSQKAPGLAPPVQSALQPPPFSFCTETLTSSHGTTRIPSVEKLRGLSGDGTLLSYTEEPPTLRSDQEAGIGNSESLQAPHPLRGKIQSLPSLNFMEKVGVWNTSRSAEKMSDALALQSSSRDPPRQKAYSAITDPLNHILLKQQSQSERREGPAASLAASSVASLCSLDKKPPSAFPLTRSRSENSVIAVGQEVSRADAGKEIEQSEDPRPAHKKDTVLEPPAAKRNDAEAEDLQAQRYTAVLVSTVLSDEETVDSVGGEQVLKRFITSERVAELLREEAASPSGDPGKTGGHWGDAGVSPCARLSASQLSMDHFSDVSPDSLNQVSSSVASSCVDMRLSPRQLSLLSGESRISLEEASGTRSPLPKTPDDGEIDIEERIPVYLRNLGIDQSPSSILTPFLPRGPIREIEFSPSELRMMKASTDAFRQGFQASEGDSRSVVNVTQSTLNSSAHSVPVPAGSDGSPETSLLAGLLPKPSRDLLGQGDAECHPGAPHAPTPHPPETFPKLPAVPQLSELGQETPEVPAALVSAEEGPTRRVQVLADRSSPKEFGAGQEKRPSASFSEEEDQTSPREEPRSLHVSSSEEGERNPFLRSKTLKEIQELWAQADAVSSRQFLPIPSVPSSMGLGSSFTRTAKTEDCGAFGSIQENSPVLQRVWSWDETLARQNIHEDALRTKTLSFAGSLKWGGTHSGDVSGNAPIAAEEPMASTQEERRLKSPGAASQGEGLPKSTERSEPEGCNSAAGARNLPLNDPLLLKSFTGSPKESQAASATEPSSGISVILEGFQQILEKIGEAGSKGTSSVPGSENSSSLDSLGIRVKSVLRGDRRVTHAAQWTEGGDRDGHGRKQAYVDHGLSFGRENTNAQESEGSSSADSMATRVRTLLEKEQPVKHAAQILQRAEEEERKALLQVKLKLAAESSDSSFDLTREDRRKIEEIKSELLLSDKAEIQERLWGSSYGGISGPFGKPEVGGRSMVPGDSEPIRGIPMPNTHFATFPVQARPACGTDYTLPRDSELKPSNSVQSSTCAQPQAHTDEPVDSSPGFHGHWAPDRGACLSAGEKGSISAEAGSAAGSSPSEAAKQITSITFASRKRSPPPPPASPVPSAGLAGSVPHDLVRLEAKSFGREQLGPRGQLPDALNPSAPASSAAAYLREDVGFSPGGGSQPVSLVVSGDESSKRKGTALEENAQTNPVEQKARFVTENHEKAVVTSHIFTGLRGNDRPLVGGHFEKVDPGGKMADWPPSMHLPQRATEKDYTQGGFSGSFGSSGHDLSSLGEPDARESVLSPSSSPVRVSVVMPSPSSPTRKALSGVHITLSPKHIGPDFPSPAATEAEMRRGDVSKSGSHPVTSGTPSLLLEPTFKLKASELYPPSQDSAYFPRGASSPGPCFSHLRSSEVANVAPCQSQELLGNRPSCSVPGQESTGVPGSGGQDGERYGKVTVSSQTESLTSDAITQITTESPEKTTYSAEIFVSDDDGKLSAGRSSRWQSHEIPRPAPSALDEVSVLDRHAGKPHLLPYKPPGSSEMYYVPCPKETLRLSRVRSGTTVESSHSGSNDAVPPEFPSQLLGSRDESSQDGVAIRHKEGIYSKRALPKIAWAEGKAAAQDRVQESAKTRSSLESVEAAHSVFRSSQFYLHPPMPLQHEIDFHAGSEALEQSTGKERPGSPSRHFFQYKGTSERSQPPFSLHQPAGELRFSPLVPELDYSSIQEVSGTETRKRETPRKEAQPKATKARHQAAKELPLPGSQRIHFKERQAAELPHGPTVHFTDGLDELWSKYLERRQQERHPGNNELSLVERLDRLAWLLQNPARRSLAPANEEQSDVQEKGRRREPKRIRAHGKPQESKSNPVAQAEGNHDTADDLSLPRDTKAAALPHRVLEPGLNSETPSDISSEARPGKGSSVLTDLSASESDAATQEEATPPTEASVSVSSIDTARLVRAFGHERVCASPKLSQLYSTIHLQRSQSEKRGKGSRRGPGAEPPKTAWPEHKRKGTQATYPVSSSDSASTPAASRGPSSALSHKRTTRMLNKAVQAGDFEIVNSATRKHTRDVGLTFPTPPASQTKLRGDRWDGREEKLTWADGPLSGSKGKHRKRPSGWAAERRTARDKLKWLEGVSWFVPAEELKSDPQKGTGSGAVPKPGPSWFEPLTGTKPWREPLREKNWPEDLGGLQARLAAPARDAENKPPPPRAKLSLQESLILHRPDFISRSGERVKRLKLIMEQRKLRSVLQSERDQLSGCPEKRRVYQNGLVSNGAFQAIRRARLISKDEMVQRSKRIYEQLPEVRKRREEEKRKLEYLTYRMKAQLYKTKITNRVLGRKVPWE